MEARAASIGEFPIDGFGRVPTVRQLVAFAAWCRRLKCRLVQTCDFYANVFGLPGAAMARVPLRVGSRRDVVPCQRAASGSGEMARGA